MALIPESDIPAYQIWRVMRVSTNLCSCFGPQFTVRNGISPDKSSENGHQEGPCPFIMT